MRKRREKQGDALDKSAQYQERKSRILCPSHFMISLNVKCFREMRGLVVRAAACLCMSGKCQELQKLWIFNNQLSLFYFS